MRAIAVHGGAWSIPDDLVEGHKKGCDLLEGRSPQEAAELLVKKEGEGGLYLSYPTPFSFLNLIPKVT